MSSGLGESHVSWPGVGCVAAGAAFALAAREFERCAFASSEDRRTPPRARRVVRSILARASPLALAFRLTPPPPPRRDAARLRDLPRYTDFAALDRDVRALEKAAAAKSRAAGNRTSTPSPSPSDAPPPVSLVVALRGAAVPEPGAPLVPCRHARATAHRQIPADGSGSEPQAPHLSALYVESTVEQHLARQIQRNGEWLRETHVVARERRECPAWAVEDRDGARVNVHRAAHEGDHSDAAAANDWVLTVAHDHFAPADADAGRSSAGNVLAHLADASAGFRILGTRRRERVLPRGTELTVVGEVTRAPPGPPGTRRREPRKEGTKGGNDAGADERDEGFGLAFDPSEGAGELRLRKARRGRRFGGVSGGRADVFVATQRSFDDHLAGLGFFGRACRTLSFACFVAGACVSVVRFVNAARTRRAARKFRERLAEAARARARGEAAAAARGGGIVGDAGADAAAVSGAADDDVLRSSVVVGEEGGSAAGLAPGETCVVCLFSRAEMCFRECGHLVCCDVCAARVDRCPLCRRKSGVMRVYRAGG